MALYGTPSGGQNDNPLLYQLVTEAVRAADAYIDFTVYDGDRDGYFDDMDGSPSLSFIGNTVEECLLSKSLKQVGERIEKDEAILEISTDKVDAEVPSPGAGVLLEIRHNEGETVEVGTVLAIVGEEAGAGAAVPTAASEPPAPVEMTVASEPEPEAIPEEPVAAAPNGDVVASLLTHRAVLAKFNHATLKAWMKYALIGHCHGIMAHNVDQKTANVYTLHRIQ